MLNYVFCGTWQGDSAHLVWLCKHSPCFFLVSIQFRVQTLPEPELRVQFRVQPKPLNWTLGPVWGSGKIGNEPNQTKLSPHYIRLQDESFFGRKESSGKAHLWSLGKWVTHQHCTGWALCHPGQCVESWVSTCTCNVVGKLTCEPYACGLTTIGSVSWVNARWVCSKISSGQAHRWWVPAHHSTTLQMGCYIDVAARSPGNQAPVSMYEG